MEPGELARVIGIHGTTMSRWRGGRVPPEPQLRHLAGALTVSLNWLKTGEGRRDAVPAGKLVAEAWAATQPPEPSIPRRVVREAFSRAWDVVADGAQAGRTVPGELVTRAFTQFARDLNLTPLADGGESAPPARAADG